ncbi:hypothetical protein AAFF_G00358420 [Aldrovandia affinis]|uniref:Uncharacterized protein n=1 Tax=Aldrovandia affinis TaxID=143900 RepID=A0AAD7T8T8_9TELE|nr:hypothetical protein AAFF_G00358420 [Aldrovandia affinis]
MSCIACHGEEVLSIRDEELLRIAFVMRFPLHLCVLPRIPEGPQRYWRRPQGDTPRRREESAPTLSPYITQLSAQRVGETGPGTAPSV